MRRVGLSLTVLFFLSPSPAAAQRAADVREVLVERLGDLAKLQVPALDEDLPQPRLPDGTVDPRFAITAGKVRLGKLLFFDPVRSTHIRPELGGTMETSRTASCGSCHLGEAASKAGVLISVGVGGEGRRTTDSRGTHFVVRTIMEGLVDQLPTPVEMVDGAGAVVLSGRFDAVDAPGRVAPSVIGFAFNQRLLWGGEAGESNPEGYPAQEDLVRLASMAHRMANPDLSHLQENSVYVRLFEHAYPDEHLRAQESGNLDDLINLDTQVRAIAAFLRTVITRNTPWDRFLAGDDLALTPSERQGAWLFAAPPRDGGAGCISCHSGPALNKLLGDEEGRLVEGNFQNLGTLEHPLVELARQTLGNAAFYDEGRLGVTANPAQAYAFKSPTLRQVRDAAPYFHGGQASTLREVIEYFNEGIAANPLASAAGTVDPLLTNPRTPVIRGLGLTEEKILALVDFLETGLYDRNFVRYNPDSTTRTFELNIEDLTYSEELKALGAVDGWLPSGLPNGFNDPVSRRQQIFIRGSSNGDSRVDIGDPIFILNFLFNGDAEPAPMMSADANDDGRVDIGDSIYLLSYLFLGGPPPAFPYPAPGQDLTP